MAERPIPQLKLATFTQDSPADFLGVVLAGGKSSRMGQDKAMLTLRGRTLLDHQAEKLQHLFGLEQVFVSGYYPSHHFLVDEEPGLGPLGGIETIVKMAQKRTSAHNSQPSFFLFIPVDMPLISKESLAKLARFAQQCTREGQRAISSLSDNSESFGFFGHELPLVIRNHPTLQTTLNQRRSGPKSSRSVRRLCECLKHKTLDTLDIPKIEFLNTNTLNEWREITHDDSIKL